MAFEALSEKPLRVEKMSVLDGIVWAFAPEYEHLMLALGGFEWITTAFCSTELASWYALLVSRRGR